MIETCKKAYIIVSIVDNSILSLECVLYIYHSIQFKKDQAKIQAVFDSDSKVNVMAPVYIARLGLKVWPTNLGAQKIDSSTFKIFEIVLASFQVNDKFDKVRFFQKTFLMADISRKVILSMLFLTLNNVDILFVEQKFT